MSAVALRSRIRGAYSFEVPRANLRHIVIRRSGNLHAETSFSRWTRPARQTRRGYEAVVPHVESIAAGKNAVSLFIPVVADSTRRNPNFYVVISDPSPNTTLGTHRSDGVHRAPNNERTAIGLFGASPGAAVLNEFCPVKPPLTAFTELRYTSPVEIRRAPDPRVNRTDRFQDVAIEH